MKVKMLVSISGTRDGAKWPEHGEIVDLPDAEASEYVAQGIAQPSADDVTHVFEAVAPVETADLSVDAEKR
jgi:hypothetical protein